MTHKPLGRIRDQSGLITAKWLLASALAATIGCDELTATRESAATIETTPQAFVARPRQHLLFSAMPSAPPAEVEAYFKATILPAISRDPRIGDVRVALSGDGRYIVELEVRTATAPDKSLAIDVLATGTTLAEGERILDGFTKYFDIRNARQLTPRPDLSISRSVLGSIDTTAPTQPATAEAAPGRSVGTGVPRQPPQGTAEPGRPVDLGASKRAPSNPAALKRGYEGGVQ